MCIKRNSKRNHEIIINKLRFLRCFAIGHKCRCTWISKFRWQISTGDGRNRRGRLCSCDEEEACTLRAMCEASRGRQLRLIRAETDSGRNDGLLNTLTCRQPSARLHFLHPSTFASFTTWPNFVLASCTHTVAVAPQNYSYVCSCWNLAINFTHFFYYYLQFWVLKKRFFDQYYQFWKKLYWLTYLLAQ